MTSPTTETSSAFDTPLHPRLADIVQFMTDVRGEVVNYARSLSEAQLTFRAGPTRWTALENLEHIGTVENSIGRLFSNLIKQLREAGSPQDTETSSLLNAVDEFRVDVAPQRITAPERLHPVGDLSLDAALDRLRETRARLLEAIQQASGLALHTVSAPHPIFGPIHGYGWLVFVPKHELRHLRQMRENLVSFSA